MRNLFVVGCPRSGTTMLMQALNRHPDIVIPPETSFFFSVVGRSRRDQHAHIKRLRTDLKIELPLPHARIIGPDSCRIYFDRLAELYLNRLSGSKPVYFGEKSPEHLRRLPEIRRSYPDGKVIVLYRDGRDVAVSLTKVPWMHHNIYVCFAVWLFYYRILRRLMAVHDPNLLFVKYEDVVTDPTYQFQRITNFLGLVYRPDMAEGYGNAGSIPEWEYDWKARALEQITAARIGTWKQVLTDIQVARLERWGGGALSALGYGLTTRGDERLPEWFLPYVGCRVVAWRLGRMARLLSS